MKVVTETVEFREKNNIDRNDFMDLLIKLKNKGTDEAGLGALTLNEIAAQAFIFFLAGFETSSTTMAFFLYKLAANPDMQDRARQEARGKLNEMVESLHYEAMIGMHCLDQIVNGSLINILNLLLLMKYRYLFTYLKRFLETLRKYPPLSILTRVSQNDYSVPGSELCIEIGTRVWTPAYAIRHSPDNYPNPEKFDPDRFTPGKVADRKSTLWLPFGDGPRICVGLRLGMMQTRIGLVNLLNNLEFMPSAKTTIPLKLSKADFILAPH